MIERSRCPVSGKIQYDTFWQANREKKRCVKNKHWVDMLIYKCKYCQKWHFSGHKYKKFKEEMEK